MAAKLFIFFLKETHELTAQNLKEEFVKSDFDGSISSKSLIPSFLFSCNYLNFQFLDEETILTN